MPPKKRPAGPLTHAELREVLHYDEKTGHFIWVKAGPRRKVGARAGSIHSSGYRVLTLFDREYKEHRLAWFWMTGVMPPDEVQIDHKNRVRDDNTWDNLREATQGQNQANTPRYGDMRGIMIRGGRSFRVRINVNGQRTSANFSSLEEAVEYRDQVFRDQWGEFSCLQRER